MSLKSLLRDVRACVICEAALPFGAQPVLQVASSARSLITSQAPGKKVHETGIAWNDASGERPRDWLGLDRPVFYDETRVAILPMGFCYTGAEKTGGDMPPRRECAPLWHARLLRHLPDIRLTSLGWPIRPEIPSECTEGLDDGNRQGICAVRAAVLPLPHPVGGVWFG
jgi:uracil-DNA glycosylase